ncbi:MAG TPA: septum formation initiator family protein [Thermoanaerobaculia bacterium]|nr:septum formation initiator family protein [Thermoanaerobaculia bacterium]
MPIEDRTALPPDPDHERFRGPAASRRERAVPSGFSWAVGLATAVLLLAIALAGARSYRDLEAARVRTAELDAEIAGAEARIVELEHRIELLRDDPVTLERLAREELGLVRPEDVVVVLPALAEPTGDP